MAGKYYQTDKHNNKGKTMNINDIKKILKAANVADDTVLMFGKHGLGKSAIVKQFSKENKYNHVEIFLSMFDVGDLMGIPRTQTIGTSIITTWAEPDWFQNITDAAWPQVNNKEDLVFNDKAFEAFISANKPGFEEITRTELNHLYCKFYNLIETRLYLVLNQNNVVNTKSTASVLFLDELNRANLDTRNACMQLILEKELHCHKLPFVNGKQTMIVAAANPTDGYQVDELDPALLDRFLTIDAEADVGAWLSWAGDTGINDIVRSYIAENPTRLHYTPKSGKGATPRSWAKLAAFMDSAESIPQEVLYPILCGKIGSELGSQFLSFYNNYSKVIKMEDIEALIAKKHKSTSKIEATAKHVAKLIEKQEAIQKQELANQFLAKYVNLPADDALPMLAYLYALELEIVNSLLKSYKESDNDSYMKLAKIDGELNQKALFKRIVNGAAQA